jgi:uncharacterized protein (TIGR00730 family)
LENFSICVFCGSRSGDSPDYIIQAEALGNLIAHQNWRLVYGAGNSGMMGAVANATQRGQAKTFGVIPHHLVQREVGKTDLDNYIITDNMHERKKLMFTNSDAIVLLPGGPGSLDEFFEVLTWAQLEVHKKPIVVINVENYWDPLFSLIDHTISKGFADNSLKKMFKITETAKEAVEYLIQLNQGPEPLIGTDL